MLLKDATSKEEVAAALEAGDDELRDDIESELKSAKRQWESNGDYCETEEFDLGDWLADNALLAQEIIKQSPGDYDLTDKVSVEDVVEAVNGQASPRGRGGRGGDVGIFRLTDHGIGNAGFSYGIQLSLNCWFPASLVPEGGEYIPADIAKDFWSDLGYSVEWQDGTDEIHENSGYAEGDSVYVEIKEDDFNEFCRDLLATHVQAIVKKDPKKAIEMFFEALAAKDKKLAEKLKASKFPKEDLIGFAEQWFTEGGSDEVVETLRNCLDDPHAGEEREVVATYSRDELVKWGIKTGTLYEEAPWTLIKLIPPSDTCMESVLMGHCVGQTGMGYNRAIEEGRIEIWSLRSRQGKPRFTLEVSTKLHDTYKDFDAEHEHVPAGETLPPVPIQEGRGDFIKQLKGKGNRTPGYERQRSGPPHEKFETEVIFWDHALRELGIDPKEVDDFGALKFYAPQRSEVAANRRRRVVRNRSFDEPYEP